MMGYGGKYCKGNTGIFVCIKRDTCVRYNKWKIFNLTPIDLDTFLSCDYYIPKDEIFFRKLKIKKLIKSIK